jgi:hypothetical protein
MSKAIEDFIDRHYPVVLSTVIALVVLLVITLGVIDCSELTHFDKKGSLVDKWHEVSCTGSYDGNGNYLGENCADEYTLVLDLGGERVAKRMSQLDFGLFKIGEAIDYQYDRGKLGGIYHQTLSHVNN